MTAPAIFPDRSTTAFAPSDIANIDVSSTDVNVAALFPAGYATKLWVGAPGASGTLKVDTVGSTGVTFTVVAGQLIQACITKVYHTGTTATGLVVGA